MMSLLLLSFDAHIQEGNWSHHYVKLVYVVNGGCYYHLIYVNWRGSWEHVPLIKVCVSWDK